MQVDVEAFDFNFGRDAQADHQIHQLQDDEGDDGAVDEHGADVLELGNHLVDVAVRQPAALGVDRVDRTLGEHAGHDGAERATNTVHAPGVQAVVIADGLLHTDHQDVAHHAGRQADDERANRVNETRSGGDGDQAGNRAGDHAQDRRLLGDDPFGNHPG